jgi:hypothetical protein
MRKAIYNPGLHEFVKRDTSQPLSKDVLRDAAKFNQIISHISEDEMNRPFTM